TGDVNVLAAARKLSEGPLRDVAVGVLHGRQDADEQTRVMRRFRDGDLQVLLATTIVEVGVDIPAASVMVIEGADKFGLAQLHQLRGRVGRDGRQAYCFLIADPTTTAARRRLHAVRASTDGFALARADLELRGPGELLGMKQSGLPDLSPLAQAAHPELLDAVDASARALLSAAANAGRGVDASLFRLVEQRFGPFAVPGGAPGV